MEDLTLEKAKELKELIEKTGSALEAIKRFIPEEDTSERRWDDKNYFFHIAKHRDGSGKSVSLNRHFGNEELIKVITETLEKQLNQFKHEFEIL